MTSASSITGAAPAATAASIRRVNRRVDFTDRDGEAGGGVAQRDEARTGLGMFDALGVDDDPFGAERLDRVADGAAVPVDVRCGQRQGDRADEAVGAAQAVDAGGRRFDRGHDGRLEAAEKIGNGLVSLRDPVDRSRAGDDADGVGVEARIVRLPQRVAPPPLAHVGVDDGHERHRLARASAHVDEEVDVGRVKDHVVDGRIGGTQLRERCGGVFDVGGVLEEGGDGAFVGRVQPGLGALHQLVEAVAQRDVEPATPDVPSVLARAANRSRSWP